jgi:OOP family OmpA-OmpF porin
MGAWGDMGRLLGVLVLVGSVLASPVSAQDRPPLGQFSVMRFSPAPGPRNYLQVEGAATPGHVQGSAGLVIDYGHQPLVLYNASCAPGGTDCSLSGTRQVLVEYVAAAHLMGSLQLFDRLQIGLVVPLALTNSPGFDHAGTGTSLPEGTSFALADPRLTVKGRLFTESGLSLALSAFVTAPTGQAIAASGYVGDGMPTFGGHAIVEYANSGFRVALNAGGVWREEATLFSTTVGPQLNYAVAFGYEITPLASVFGEVVGTSGFSAQIDEHWLEWRVGGRLRFSDFEMNLAGGTGLITGVGTPLFRVVLGGAWAPVRSDTDGDGVDDSRDSCPSEAEDLDDYEDEDGCPEADNDGDEMPDATDRCPNEAEDVDGHEDEDGCPDTDNDGDGIADGYDSCPNDAEDMDGDRDEDGCPDNDTDRDGIADADDRCPEEAEDFDGFGDDDGCPETDFDEDGVPDEADQCPEQPEDRDGVEDEDGCPDEDAPARPGRR